MARAPQSAGDAPVLSRAVQITPTTSISPTASVVVTETADLQTLTVAGEGRVRIRIEVERTEELTSTMEIEATPATEATPEAEATPETEAAEEEESPTIEATPEMTPTAELTATAGITTMPGVEVTESEGMRVVRVQSGGRIRISVDIEPTTALTPTMEMAPTVETTGTVTPEAEATPEAGATPETEETPTPEAEAATPEAEAVVEEEAEVGAAEGLAVEGQIAVSPIVEFSTLDSYDVINPDGETLGEIDDLLINLETGEVVLAMVEFGGFLGLGQNIVPIPMDAVQWAPDLSMLVVDLPEEALEEAPSVGEEWPDLTDEAWIGEAEEAWHVLNLESPAEMGALVGRVLSAEQLLDVNIQNTDGEDLGNTDDALIDLENGMASYAIVSFGDRGERSAVPLTVFQFTSEDGDVVAILDVVAEQLAEAPIFDPAAIDFAAPDWDVELREFWGVEDLTVEEEAEAVETEAEEEETELLVEPEEEQAEAEVETIMPMAEITPTMGISVTETDTMRVILLETMGRFQIQIQVVPTGGFTPTTEVEAVPGAEVTPEAAETPTPEAEATPETEGTPTPEAEAAGEEAAEANTVQVSLVEYSIEMPDSLPTGPTVFEVTNDGSIEHNFEIEGQGMEEVFEENLQPGETRTMQVDLAPGEYTVYCPVGDHREQGMELTLTVSEE